MRWHLDPQRGTDGSAHSWEEFGAHVRMTGLMRQPHELLERNVSGTFADTEKGSAHLTRPGGNRGQGIGECQPCVVVAVPRYRKVHARVLEDGTYEGDLRGRSMRQGGPDRVIENHRTRAQMRRLGHGVAQDCG
ncbi:hypothetical protein CcI49_14915 [Frankia sp. CcI49]|nr:hypothetical protein ACG83_28350 [Frankia sp. R43]ONH59991.1 hypothetical protein CcI49_14915 [Frankia sp. CcI49]